MFFDFYRAERIFAEAQENGNHYFYVKWENLPYSEATWELEDIVKSRFGAQVCILTSRFHRILYIYSWDRPEQGILLPGWLDSQFDVGHLELISV